MGLQVVHDGGSGACPSPSYRPSQLASHLPFLPTIQSPTNHPGPPPSALPLRQGDESKQEAAQQYASEKGVELDKGPGSS